MGSIAGKSRGQNLVLLSIKGLNLTKQPKQTITSRYRAAKRSILFHRMNKTDKMILNS
jgi:hypothetical protein